VLMAGVLTPRVLALATAAVATLALLLTAWLTLVSGGGEATLLMTQAGLAGSGFFVITVLAGELAGRLAREQLSARGSLEMARQQAQLNRLVIEEMEDGVLVVDRAGKMHAANPAARRLLAPEGMSRTAPFQLRGVPAWGALVRAVERAFAEAAWPEAGRDVAIEFGPEAHRTLRVRVRFTRKREPPASEAFCVLFLEDVRNVQARSRQEKLAAMGRVSAGIAHEIRNPLAAIAQANALLSEDAFCDLSLPHWRVQGEGPDAVYGIREGDHPFRGTVRVEALDRTARGFLLQFEERWEADGQQWYCRELLHALVTEGRISELSVYCTGDWDAERQRLHAEQVRLLRP